MNLKSWIAWKGANIGFRISGKLLWPRASAASLVIEDNKILVVDTGDYLMLPGGGLEYGENFEKAAKREALEETGYKISINGEIYKDINSVGGVEVIFEAELEKQDSIHQGDWEGEPVWIDIDEIEDRTWRYNRNVKALLKGKQS